MTNDRQCFPSSEKKLVHLLQQPSVFKCVGDFLQSPGDHFATPHRADVEREICDERKHHPPIHPECAALARHRDEMLRLWKIASQLEHQVRADMVMAINDHAWRGEFCGPLGERIMAASVSRAERLGDLAEYLPGADSQTREAG